MNDDIRTPLIAGVHNYWISMQINDTAATLIVDGMKGYFMKAKALALVALAAMAIGPAAALAGQTGTTTTYTTSWTLGSTNTHVLAHDYYDGVSDSYSVSSKEGFTTNGIKGEYEKSKESGVIAGTITGTVQNPETDSTLEIFGESIPSSVFHTENPASTSTLSATLNGTFSGNKSSFEVNFNNPSIMKVYDASGNHTIVHIYGDATTDSYTTQSFGSNTSSITSSAFNNF